MCGYVCICHSLCTLSPCMSGHFCQQTVQITYVVSIIQSFLTHVSKYIHIFVKGHTIYNIQYTCLFVMQQVCKYCFLFLIKTLSIFISKETSHKCGFNFTKVTSKPSQNPEKSLYLSLLKEYFLFSIGSFNRRIREGKISKILSSCHSLLIVIDVSMVGHAYFQNIDEIFS